VFRYSRRAIALVWQTSRRLTFALAALTVVAGVLPAAAAWVGQLIVDSVVTAIELRRATGRLEFAVVAQWVVVEAGIIAGLAATQRGLMVCESLLRAMLGHRVNVMILEKALTLELTHFEDSEF
jgi:ATP-binding cassette, subfamily B, bacterial